VLRVPSSPIVSNPASLSRPLRTDVALLPLRPRLPASVFVRPSIDLKPPPNELGG
jgi:hypothetical protein